MTQICPCKDRKQGENDIYQDFIFSLQYFKILFYRVIISGGGKELQTKKKSWKLKFGFSRGANVIGYQDFLLFPQCF